MADFDVIEVDLSKPVAPADWTIDPRDGLAHCRDGNAYTEAYADEHGPDLCVRAERPGQYTKATIPLPVVAALLRAAGWTVGEPGTASAETLEREAADVHRMAAWERARAEDAECERDSALAELERVRADLLASMDETAHVTAELARVRPVVEAARGLREDCCERSRIVLDAVEMYDFPQLSAPTRGAPPGGSNA